MFLPKLLAPQLGFEAAVPGTNQTTTYWERTNMHTIETHWEDEENNRRVAFDVRVTRTNNAVEIQSLTPKQVTFLCPQSNAPLRSIGVWTDKGRELLADQFRASEHIAQLEKEIDATLAV
jgi:hypothetical protein